MPLFRLNPQGTDATYLNALRVCFPGWGDEDDFRWWFRRRVGGPPADLLVLEHGSEPVAGMALSYRRVALCPGEAELLGILTGAWTHPEHRNRGYFSELVERARAVGAQRGIRIILAWVGLSRKGLNPVLRAAQDCTDTQFLECPAAPAITPVGREHPEAKHLRSLFHRHRLGAALVYPTTAIFAEQARLASPLTRVVPAGPDAWAILDFRGRPRTRCLITSRPCDPQQLASLLSRLPVSYTTHPDVAAAAAKLGMTSNRALLATFLTGVGPPLRLPVSWDLQDIDRA